MKWNSAIRLKVLTYGVIAYMCFAFAWWSSLLYIKNKNAFLAKVEVLRLVMIVENSFQNEAHFKESEPYLNLTEKYKKQEWMVLGEAAILMLSLVAAIWIINNGYTSLIRAAHQKRNFLLSITHELKSPIASSKLGLETLKKRQLSDVQKKKIVNGSLQELDRLKNLVDNLLLTAKVERNYEPVFETENINSLIQKWMESFYVNFPKIEFDLNLDTKEHFIEIDRQAIESVFKNLVENAIKYGDDQNWVGISTQFKAKHWVLEVRDRGIGIPDLEQKQIFDLFYRVGNEDTRKTKGTGLGLYIIKQMTHAHKGEVMIENNEQKGSIFKIIIPKIQ